MLSGLPSTLWRVSEFEQRYRTESSMPAGFDGPRVMTSSLMGELDSLQRRHVGRDVVEVLAACRRAQEQARLYVRLDDLIWPITVFPHSGVYHSRHDLLRTFESGVRDLEIVAVEPSFETEPGQRERERSDIAEFFRPLRPALWSLAISSPTRGLLKEIAGTAAYRALRRLEQDGMVGSGAIGHAARRLHTEAASLRHVAQWPGMSLERAIRLLNALYLTSNLMVTRSHPRARPEPTTRFGLGTDGGPC